MSHDISTFLSQVGTLPSLPILYTELSREVGNPNASIESIGAIVRKDQSLTSRLLKLSNSALYSFPCQVETIEEALQLIGLREMCDLALATSVINSFKNLPPELVNVPDFWKHSIGCGVAAGLVAEHNHDPAAERFFVGGLLHDIGRLILYLKARAESTEIFRLCQRDNLPPCVVERQILGFDHALLGGELLALWRLPPTLVEMVRRHHHPLAGHAAGMDVAAVHYADFLVTALEIGNSGEYTVSPLSEEARKRCGLESFHIEPLVQELETRCGHLCPILTSDTP